MKDRRRSDRIPPGILINVPVAPRDLDDIGRQAWATAGRFLVDKGLLNSGDLDGLRTYSHAVSLLRRLEAEAADAPLLIAASRGEKPNPIFDLVAKQNAVVRAWSRSLMLVPLSRRSLSKSKRDAPPKSSVQNSEWDGLIDFPSGKDKR